MDVVKIEARDLPEAWFKALRAILEKGYQYTIDKGSFEGQQRKELDFLFMEIKMPSNRPLIPIVPSGVPAPTSMDYVDDYMRYLLTSEKTTNEQYTYGEHIEKQIFHIIENLKKHGFNSNQTYITVGRPESVELDDPECLRGIDIRIRYGAVHFFVYYRSWDMWAGFPSNVAAIQLMKEWVAMELGVADGEMIVASKGAHLYDYTWDIAKVACGLA